MSRANRQCRHRPARCLPSRAHTHSARGQTVNKAAAGARLFQLARSFLRRSRLASRAGRLARPKSAARSSASVCVYPPRAPSRPREAPPRGQILRRPSNLISWAPFLRAQTASPLVRAGVGLRAVVASSYRSFIILLVWPDRPGQPRPDMAAALAALLCSALQTAPLAPSRLAQPGSFVCKQTLVWRHLAAVNASSLVRHSAARWRSRRRRSARWRREPWKTREVYIFSLPPPPYPRFPVTITYNS